MGFRQKGRKIGVPHQLRKRYIPLLSLSETAIPQHLMKWLFQRFDLKIDFLIDLVGWVERSESQQPRKQD